jgi:hypothetical protein
MNNLPGLVRNRGWKTERNVRVGDLELRPKATDRNSISKGRAMGRIVGADDEHLIAASNKAAAGSLRHVLDTACKWRVTGRSFE